MEKTYIEIVRLLLESAPAIFETPHFAMKGGTAINLFIEDNIHGTFSMFANSSSAAACSTMDSMNWLMGYRVTRLTRNGLYDEPAFQASHLQHVPMAATCRRKELE